MKRIFPLAALAVSLALPSLLAAQVANAPSPRNQNASSSLLAQNQTLAWSSPQDQTAPPPPPPPPPVVNNPPDAYTYNHGEVGAFADYFRFNPPWTQINFIGVGGRVSFNVHPNLALEAEMNYDFARNVTSTSTSGTTSTTTSTTTTTGIRPITALFGPKIQFGTHQDFRAFVTGKAGFIEFTTSNPNNVSGSGFSNGISGFGGSGTYVAFYPGAGVEGFWGPFGLRLDAGDEIWLDNGTYNNLRVTFGPTFRF